jgi:hypothetical protein
MKFKNALAPLLILGLILALGVSCQRTADPAPDPFGPGTSRLTMDLEANPNILYVTTAGRATSQITAAVKMDGAVYSGATVIFTVESGSGEFTNYQRRISVTTNGNGVATATFVSPSLAEFSRDYDVTIEAIVQTSSPFYLLKSVSLRVMRPRE